MVTQSWCSGLCLASFSSLTSDLYVFIILYPMGWFCFCSGLSLRGARRRILHTVLPLTFTTGTQHCSCQWWFWNVYTGQMWFQASKRAWKNIARCRGEWTAWTIHCINRNGTAASITWHLSSCTQILVPISAEVSEEWLAFTSDVCDPSGLWSQEHAASRRAVYSCRWQLSCSQRCLIDVTCRNHAFHAYLSQVQ